VAAIAVTIVLVLALSQGGAQSAGSPTSPAATGPPAQSEPVRMAVVGDSISYGDSADFPGGALGDASWVRWAVDERLVFAGGWAVPGAVTEAMAENVRPYDADVLVILAGTNDLAFGIPAEQTMANLARIAETAGVGRVVLVGIPPNDFLADAVTHYNAALRSFAAEQRWEFADAAAPLRADGNTFGEGMTWDGVHPTVDGARLLGEGIRAHVLD
jgi:phospholipase/lecithinase/hemolysin